MNRVRDRYLPLWYLVVSIFIVGIASCRHIEIREEDRMVSSIGMSEFVFIGQIEKLGDTTMPSLQASSHTAVVRVRKVLKGPDFFTKHPDPQVTVLLKDLSGAEKGRDLLFMANAWVLGKGIALREVGRQEKYSVDILRKQIALADEAQFKDRVIKAYRGADVVVRGKVLAVRDVSARAGRPVISEHDPQWHEATVEVQAYLKGGDSKSPVRFYFPMSMDVAWYQVPKYKVGQRGIWMMQRDPQLEAYSVKNRFDFFTEDQADRVGNAIRTLK